MSLELLPNNVIQELENLLIEHVYEDQWKHPWDGQNIPQDLVKSYIAHAKKLSSLFTKDRQHLNSRYFNKKENRYAYIFYFHISSFMRTYHVINEMFRHGIWPENADTFMDLGSGSGGSLWALGMYRHQRNLPIQQVYAIDQDQHVLKDAKKLWSRLIKHFNIEAPELSTYKQDLLNIQKLETDDFYHKVDIVFCSNVLNEFSKMSEASKLTLFKTIALHVLKKNGLLVIIEPALSETARKLMELRDLFLENIAADVPIPCGHTMSCPLLKDPKEWCHFELTWEPPKLRKKIEDSLGFHSGVLKYSYLVFKKKSLEAPAFNARKRYRVLSPALKNGNEYCVLLCSESDVLSLYFSKDQKELKNIRRGNLLEVGAMDEFSNKSQRYQRSVRLNSNSNPKIVL
jgi:ribosomal protein RSM22 (predicted rRNA methylase)